VAGRQAGNIKFPSLLHYVPFDGQHLRPDMLTNKRKTVEFVNGG
jgi:hypothetical protein